MHFAFLAAFISLCSLQATTAHALEMQEVVVYSSLDQGMLENTAASIAIFEADWLTRNNTQHIEQLLGAAPNVNFSSGASRARFVQMRGIGDIEQFVDPKAYPSVGLVIDGIDFSGLFGAALLFDTQQVEVQRGPQGTALGASALAGSINIVSMVAGDANEAFIETGVGKYSSTQIGGAISGPVSANTGVRIAARKYRSDGYIENRFLGRENTGRQDEFIGKGQINWLGDNNEAVKITALHIENDNGYDAFSLGNTGVVTRSDKPGNDKQRVTALAATFSEPVFHDSEIQYRITWLQADTLYSYDEDWADPSICDAPASCGFGFFDSFDAYQRSRNDYSAEFKLQNDAYLFGFFAQDREVELQRNRIGDAPLALSSRYQTERLALFGQLSPTYGENLRIKIGARYEWFDDEYVDSASIASDSRDELWQMNASLKYALSGEAQLYLLASRGNKAGGVNTDASTNITSIDTSLRPELLSRLRYASESLSNYEIGVDFSSADGVLQGKVGLFYNLRNNPQFETFLFDNLSSFLFVGYQDNADRAESHGLEVQLAQRFNQHLLLEYSAAFIDSRIQGFRIYDFDTAAFRDIDGKEQPRAATYQYHAAATWSFNENISTTLSAEGRDSYQYAYYFDAESGHINLLHASLRYQHERVTFIAWLRNLRDEQYPVQGLYFANDPRDDFSINRLYTQVGEPRNGGVTFRYNF